MDSRAIEPEAPPEGQRAGDKSHPARRHPGLERNRWGHISDHDHRRGAKQPHNRCWARREAATQPRVPGWRVVAANPGPPKEPGRTRVGSRRVRTDLGGTRVARPGYVEVAANPAPPEGTAGLGLPGGASRQPCPGRPRGHLRPDLGYRRGATRQPYTGPTATDLTRGPSVTLSGRSRVSRSSPDLS